MAMENTHFFGTFPIETPISSGFPIATFDYWRVSQFEFSGDFRWKPEDQGLDSREVDSLSWYWDHRVQTGSAAKVSDIAISWVTSSYVTIPYHSWSLSLCNIV